MNGLGAGDSRRERLRGLLTSEAIPQDHALAHWERLSASERDRLARQIEALDLATLTRLYAEREAALATSWRDLALRAEPPQAVRLADQQDAHRRAAARRTGEATLRAGEVGVMIVAGGQGTRLRFEHPKGTYALGPVSGRTLFQILIDKVLAVGHRFGASLPVYLMTSAATHDETLAYFDAHARCGLAADDLRIFRQGDMPAVDAATGRLLLDAPDRLALSPDGHGGMLAAFAKSGLLAEARARGIRRVFYCQVDNPLVQIGQPEFLGWHLLENSEVTTQVVSKRFALERVGNVVQLDGRAQVIEYSDLPAEVAEQRSPDGGLRLWAGNIAVHIFELDFLDRMSAGAGELPFHLARKAVPYVDESGTRVTPTQPNAIKFERFIFDLLPAARRALVVEGAAADTFAPVKNHDSEGIDSPATARAAMIDQAKRWLQAAGVEIADGTPLELNPRFAWEPDDLAGRFPAGTRFDVPTYLA